MAVDPKEEHKAELHRAFEKCQFVEETLKLCILSAIDIARIRVQPFFPLMLRRRDIRLIMMIKTGILPPFPFDLKHSTKSETSN